MRRPKQNSFWKSKLRIGAFTRGAGSFGVHQSGSHFAGLVTGVKIYSYGRDSDDIYATTIHELAHSSHYEMSHYNFRHTDTKVKESWARGVQWALTRMVYTNHLGRGRSTGDYTLVVADMIDDDSTDRTNFGYGRNSWETQDSVSGYTIRQIENALLYGRNWNSWRNNLINQNTNPTEENLSNLFKAYE